MGEGEGWRGWGLEGWRGLEGGGLGYGEFVVRGGGGRSFGPGMS